MTPVDVGVGPTGWNSPPNATDDDESSEESTGEETDRRRAVVKPVDLEKTAEWFRVPKFVWRSQCESIISRACVVLHRYQLS